MVTLYCLMFQDLTINIMIILIKRDELNVIVKEIKTPNFVQQYIIHN